MEPGRAYGSFGAKAAEVEAIRAIYDAFARRDVDGALVHIGEDVEFYPQGTAERTGRALPYRGHVGVREYFADAARTWDELTLHADDIRAIAGSVIVFGHVRGRIGGETVERRVLWTWKVVDGRAVSMRVNSVG